MNLITDAYPFPNADKVYSRAYRVLESMGFAEYNRLRRNPKTRKQLTKLPNSSGLKSESYYVQTEDMARLQDALSRGDEEQIKGLLLVDPYWEYRE